LNCIRISAEAEREWQLKMQQPNQDLETKAMERAVKAGDASVKSDRHVSKRSRRIQQPKIGTGKRPRPPP
jgi:hypothetical protein